MGIEAEDRVRKGLDDIGMAVFVDGAIVPIGKAVCGHLSLGNLKSAKKNRPIAYIRSEQSPCRMKIRADAAGRAVSFYDCEDWEMSIFFAVINEKDKDLVFETAKKLCTPEILGGCERLAINIKQYSSEEPCFVFGIPIVPIIRRYFYIEYNGLDSPLIKEYA